MRISPTWSRRATSGSFAERGFESAISRAQTNLRVTSVRGLSGISFARSGASPEDVELVIVGTTTPDYPFPSVAALLQDKFGMSRAGAVDIQATCAGFAYGLHLANGLVSAGVHDRVLVVAGETLSKVIDDTDRATCVLFGDGAGAALVDASTPPAILATSVGADGSGAPASLPHGPVPSHCRAGRYGTGAGTGPPERPRSIPLGGRDCVGQRVPPPRPRRTHARIARLVRTAQREHANH